MRTTAIGFLLLSTLAVPPCLRSGEVSADAETRVLEHIRTHLRPGQPVLITELYGKVFTQPEERKVLDKLYSAFFRIPLFVVQHTEKLGAPPALSTLAEQFNLKDAQAAAVLLGVMESDPRVPRFFSRDATTGEITRVDTEKIRSDPRFGQAVTRHLSGWEGQPAPQARWQTLAGETLDAAALRGKHVLLYIWFTGCPPCLKQTPELVALHQEFSSRNLTIVGANADRLLGLSYDDAMRTRYLQEEEVSFPVVHWTRESDAAFGHIAIFPTIFLLDPEGVIMRHWVGYVSPSELRPALRKSLALGEGQP